MMTSTEAANWLLVQRLEEKVRQAQAQLATAQSRLFDAERLLALARAGAVAISDEAARAEAEAAARQRRGKT